MASKVAFGSDDTLLAFPTSMFKVPTGTKRTIHTAHVKKPTGLRFRTTIPNIKPKAPTSIFASDSAFGSSASFDPFYGIPKPPKKSAGDLTPQEAFALGYQTAHHDGGSGSFLDSIKHHTGSILDHALDYISRPSHAVARGYDLATQDHRNVGDILSSNFIGDHTTAFDAFKKGFMQGIEGKSNENFGDILRRRNPKANPIATTAAGFGLDVVTDPTTYLFGAGEYAKAGKFGLKFGTDAIDKGGALKALGRESKIPELGKDATQEQVAAHVAHQALEDRLARLELEGQSNKYLTLRIGPTKGASFGLQTPIRLARSKDARLAALESAGPLRTSLAKVMASVRPGYLKPTEHVMENHVKHFVETNSQMAASHAIGALKPYFEGGHKLSELDTLKALLASQTPGTAAHGVLNEDMLRHTLQGEHGMEGDKLESAVRLIQGVHSTGRKLAAMDKAAGVAFKDVTEGEDGTVYVPKIFQNERDVAQITRKPGLSAHAHYEKESKLTLEQAIALHQAGKGRRLVTDPLDMMTRRIEKGSVGQAGGHIRQYLMRNFAVPDKVLGSPERVAKAMGKTNRLKGEFEKHSKALEEHGTLRNAQRRLKTTHTRELKALALKTHGKIPPIEEFRKGHDAEKIIEASREVAARTHGAVRAQAVRKGEVAEAMIKRDYANFRRRAIKDGTARGFTTKELADRKATYQHLSDHANTLHEKMADIRREVEKTGRKHTKAESLQLARLTKRYNVAKSQMREVENEEQLAERHSRELIDVGVKHAQDEHVIRTALNDTAKAIAKAEPKGLRKAFVKNPALKNHLVPLSTLKQTHDVDALRAQVGDDSDFMVKMHEAAALKETSKGLTVNYHVPREIHEAVTRIDAVLSDPEKMSELTRMMSKAMSKWKLYVTMANPGYGMRNSMSDIWNAYITGMPAWAFPTYAGKAAKLMRDAHNAAEKAAQGIEPTAAEKLAQRRILEAAYHGGLTGFFNTDIRQALSKSKSRWNLVRKMTTGNIARENLGRMTHYLYRIEHEGMSVEGAMKYVKEAHFDYEDLTPTEQKIKGTLIPFYTWTRKNVPLQIQRLISAPGKMSVYPKLASEVEGGTGLSPGELAQTVYQEHPLAFKTPLGYFDPNIGLSDLARITDPSQLAQMVNPFIQVPLEAATNLNFFTGDAIRGPDAPHALTPAPGLLEKLVAPLGLGGETARKVEGGKTQHSPGINNLLALVMGETPLGSELLSRNDVTARSSKPFGKVAGQSITPRDLSYLAGLSFTRPDQDEEAYLAGAKETAQEQAALKAAREAGTFPAAKKRKKSAYQKQMEALLRKQLQRG